jgi:hypothetical protein
MDHVIGEWKYTCIEGKLLCLKFNLLAGRQAYREIASRKIYQSEHNHLSLGKIVVKQKGSYLLVFKAVDC